MANRDLKLMIICELHIVVLLMVYGKINNVNVAEIRYVSIGMRSEDSGPAIG